MPKNNTAVKDVVDSIPNERLKDFVTSKETIFEDRNTIFGYD